MSEPAPVPPHVASPDAGHMIRMLSHDLANALNTLLMNAELARLQLDRNNGTAAREALDRLLGEGRRCGQLLQACRRYGAGMTAGPRETSAIAELINAAIAEQTLPLRTLFRVDGEAVNAVVDRQAMIAVLTELLRNSVEAEAANVRINVSREADAVLIQIVDDGIGIAPTAIEHATEPFFSTRRDSGAGGLGLALASQQIQAHGGSLRIARNEGVGTRVEVRLPYSLLAE